MKTASLTYPAHHYPAQHHIDTAPLAARYEVLIQAMLSFITAGQFGRVLRYSQKIARLVRVFIKLDAQNVLQSRKLTMLSDKPWRERVLSDLGGTRKLRLWEAAHARSLTRIETKSAKHDDVMQPWLYTPERRAESERLKAHVRMCRRAAAPERVFRDRYKMDFDGAFRLAPVMRGKGRARQIKIYTQNTIADYVWNPIPFAKTDGLGLASVWPVEFYAAAALETETDTIMSERVIPSKTHKRYIKTTLYRPLPLHLALPPKTYRAIFENPV